MSKLIWFSVLIVFEPTVEVDRSRFRFLNCNGKTVHQLRQQLTLEGLQLIVDSSTWVVIFPWQVRSFTIHRQEKFYTEYSSDNATAVFSKDQTIQQ